MSAHEGQGKLILLDINGVLCAKIPNGELTKRQLKEWPLVPLNKHCQLLVAPGIVEEIRALKDKGYTLGVFSSTEMRNVKKTLEMVFGSSETPFSIIADRALTQLDPDYGKDPQVQVHDTVKKLARIWQSPLLNPDRRWNATNTVLVEHDYRRVRFCPSTNVVLVPEFDKKAYMDGFMLPLQELVRNWSLSTCGEGEMEPATCLSEPVENVLAGLEDVS